MTTASISFGYIVQCFILTAISVFISSIQWRRNQPCPSLIHCRAAPLAGSAAVTAPSNPQCTSMASLKNQFWPTFPYAECPASRYCSSFVHHMQRSSWKHLTFVNSVTLYETRLALCMFFRFPNWKCIKAKPIPPLVKCCTRKISSKLKTSGRLSAQNQQAHRWMDPTEQKYVSAVSSASSRTQKGTFNTTSVNGKTPGRAASPGSHRQSKQKQKTSPVYAVPTLS